jgi:hypothetical protein
MAGVSLASSLGFPGDPAWPLPFPETAHRRRQQRGYRRHEPEKTVLYTIVSEPRRRLEELEACEQAGAPRL